MKIPFFITSLILNAIMVFLLYTQAEQTLTTLELYEETVSELASCKLDISACNNRRQNPSGDSKHACVQAPLGKHKLYRQ